MSDIPSLEAFADDLIAALSPVQRKALAKDIAKYLRPAQTRRIAAQLNPDGSPYEPRKPQIRHRIGKIRRTMFAKLRTSKYLKTQATADGATLSFTGGVEHMALVHQLGLRDVVNRITGKEATYPARELLGMTDDDKAALRALITTHLAENL